VIPDIAPEELLECTRSDVVEQRHRLDTLAWQTAELPTDVMGEMLTWFGSPEAVGELAQCGAETKQLIGRHP
jgi:hypothetical protein